MREVADRAGVAVSSVSRVLNDHPDVSSALRSRVTAAIAALGYEPDYMAQSLRRGSSRTIGFLLRDISNPLFGEIVRGAERCFRDMGYAMLLADSEGDPELDAAHIQLLSRRRVDGLILSLESEDHSPTLSALRNLTSAVVLIDRQVAAPHASSVVSDHYSGVRLGVLDLIRKDDGAGVAFIGGPDVRASRERLRGYLDAHVALGHEPDSEFIRQGSYATEFGYEQAMSLLSRSPRPNGIFAGGLQIALGALSAMRDSAVDVGDDINLVGCDGASLLRLIDSRIGIVDRDATQIGETAANLIVELIDGGQPRVVTLPTRYEPGLENARGLPVQANDTVGFS